MSINYNDLSSILGDIDGIRNRIEEIEKREGFKLIEDEAKVTNELILSYDIVGVIMNDEDDLPAVNIIKNRMNNVTGIVPFSMWLSLIEDKIALNEKQKSQKDEDEDSVPDLDEIFNDFSKAFSNTFDDIISGAGEAVERIRPEATKIKKDMSGNYPTLKSILGEIAKNISEMVEPSIDEAAINIKIAKLETIRDEAINEGVSTKKFIKKINSKIKDLSLQLGN
jgi:hypothetical protein